MISINEIKYSLKKLTERFFTQSISKWQIKFLLAMLASLIIIAVIYYTQLLVDELITREQKIVKFYAEAYKHYADPNENVENSIFFLDEITPNISFPIISTNENDEPNSPYEQYTLNVEFEKNLTLPQKKDVLMKNIADFSKTYPPVILTDKEGKIIAKFYYTHSKMVSQLRYFPVIAIIIIFSFVLIGYIAFSNIRRSEESKVWVGMAKEAAHQLGTPLSSMLAWIEIIRMNKNNPNSVENTVDEMQNDVNRLNTIATRFSKIGSMPEKRIEDISEIIESTCTYFDKRLPHLGKKVEIIRKIDKEIVAEVSIDLFQWVIENLLKNAAESIENQKGKVVIDLHQHQNKKILISVRDSGKGMSSQVRRQIFYPGFTTKKRGWGLGLSLCKRIIEEYHNGKIYVKESALGKGTTFQIELPYSSSNT